MSTPVLMPQMGESIAEGTIVRWIKQVGDPVDRDEPLFEISTDKVDAEIPSPAAGVLVAIAVREGETVPVNSIVATIAAHGDSVDLPTATSAGLASSGTASGPPSARPAAARDAVAAVADRVRPEPPGPVADLSLDERRRLKSSPLVRRIARDHGVDLRDVRGAGVSGRVTKADILRFLDTRSKAPGPSGAYMPAFTEGSRTDVRPLSVMRKKIAEHMMLSRRTSAHVHTVFHVNFSAVERLRQQRKADYERDGVKLTYMAFITAAVVEALRRFPILNASLDGDTVVYKQDINIGIAVAIETGLIVPVVKQAGERSLLSLSRAIADVADRARARQLKPEDVQGGTFTITNPGNFGAQFGMPIINQPQAGILGIGTIEKRAIVVDDAIAIRMMGYLTLGFDHRLVDGAVADQFMADIRQQIEQFDPARV